MFPPFFDYDLRVPQAVEDFSVEQFVSEPVIEALAISLFLGGSWLDVSRLRATAAIQSLTFGIPLGIWFGKSNRAYGMAEPVLDLMQTLPAFLYLIPIIAFFGTCNPPGILGTITFGMPPVIRLTALGMESIKKAADAFGATRQRP